MSSISIHFIKSLTVEQNKYGSKNDIPIKSIGVFELDLQNLPVSEFIGLTFPNDVDNRTEEVVIPYTELKEKLNRNYNYSSKLLVLWLMHDGHVYNVTNIGTEGELFFIGGRMAKDTKMDLTKYLKKNN